MRQCRSGAVIALLVSMALSGRAQTKTIAERLGYPPDSKLLIIHADDLAVAHSVDAASFGALDKNAVTSASVMVHLTLTSEWKIYRWGPVEAKDKVPSLLDPAGYLWSETAPAAQNSKPEEAEREIRAQIERAMAAGIHATHLDSHMGVLFARPELFAILIKVAHEYHLPFLAPRFPGDPNKLISLLSPKDVVLDSIVIANPTVHADQWKEFYGNAIKNLKPGLSEIIVHLGHDDAELQAVTLDHPDYGSAWRQRDYDLVTSLEFKKLLKENHIVLVKWSDLQKLLK